MSDSDNDNSSVGDAGEESPKMPTTDELKHEIVSILKSADLSVLSAKRVRKQLEEKFGHDLSEQFVELQLFYIV